MKTNPDDPVNAVGSSSYKYEDSSCLTKREYIAITAFHAILVKGDNIRDSHDREAVSDAALAMADSLIERLNK